MLNKGSENGDKWIPGEVDTSIRPGWFYHTREDSLVKTPETLFEIFLSSVGRGSNLLLNIPPDRRGRFHENDVQALRGFKTMLDSAFAADLALGANVKASEVRGNSSRYAAQLVVDGDPGTYWTTEDATTTGSLEIDLGEEKKIKLVQLQEYISLGQRVRSFTVEAWKDNAWQQVAEGTTVGYKRILQVDPVTTSKVKITITDARACPVISSASLY